MDVLKGTLEMRGHLRNFAPKSKNGKLGLMGSKENKSDGKLFSLLSLVLGADMCCKSSMETGLVASITV